MSNRMFNPNTPERHVRSMRERQATASVSPPAIRGRAWAYLPDIVMAVIVLTVAVVILLSEHC